MVTLVSFILYFIVPKFEAIFADFGLPLPQVTTLVIQVSHFVVRYFFIVGGALFLAMGLLVLMLMTAAGWISGSGARPRQPIPPPTHRRHLAALARVVEAGKPLSLAFGTLARRYPTTGVRDRLRSVALDIDRGSDSVRGTGDQRADQRVRRGPARIGEEGREPRLGAPRDGRHGQSAGSPTGSRRCCNSSSPCS